MDTQDLLTYGGAGFLALVVLVVLWLRKPVFHWYCRRCKKVVCLSRRPPGKCVCGTKALIAYFCTNCAGWNTSPAQGWHCETCSSKDVTLGAEYHPATALWMWRNQPDRH